MKLRFGYLLFIVDSKPEGHAGATKGPIVRIQQDYKDDVGLEKHEAGHVALWWIFALIVSAIGGIGGFYFNPLAYILIPLSTIVEPLLYNISSRYREWAEVRCYKRQLNYPPANGEDQYRQLYAEFISTGYNLNITKEEALEKLQ